VDHNPLDAPIDSIHPRLRDSLSTAHHHYLLCCTHFSKSEAKAMPLKKASALHIFQVVQPYHATQSVIHE
jgi:hypothetical protein